MQREEEKRKEEKKRKNVSETTEKQQGKRPTLLGILPLAVLAACCGILCFSLCRLSPILQAGISLTDHSYPAVTALISFLHRFPFMFSLALFTIGGILFFVTPKHRPLQLTAWYLAACFLTGLWITLIVLIPFTAFTDHYPLL